MSTFRRFPPLPRTMRTILFSRSMSCGRRPTNSIRRRPRAYCRSRAHARRGFLHAAAMTSRVSSSSVIEATGRYSRLGCLCRAAAGFDGRCPRRWHQAKKLRMPRR